MSRRPRLLAVAALIACFCAVSVSAQRRPRVSRPPDGRTAAPPAEAQKNASQVSVESADVAITATVTAKELRFEVVPNPIVEFPGKPARDTVWDAERENLPRPVEPGVTYRNIGIRLKIVSRFQDIDRIVAEALGEVPVTDKVEPSEDSPSQPATPPPPAPTTPQGGRPQ